MVGQPLYRYYNINVDWSVFKNSIEDHDAAGAPDEDIEPLDVENAPASELIISRQQTMLWNEGRGLDIAPGQNRVPASSLYDQFAEEITFPQVYLGIPRQIKPGVRATPYTMCMSEIRRADRRGAKPQHVLYRAMKMLRIRVQDGIENMFRCMRTTENLTRSMIEDCAFVERLIDMNQAFMKTIPNSVQYWNGRKKRLVCNDPPTW